MIVAIDGPAGSGKSTVARVLAQRLGLRYLDTGAMYRCVALAAVRGGVDLSDDAAVGSIALGLRISFRRDEDPALPARVFLDNDDVTLVIRTPAIDSAVSRVAGLPSVRAAMVKQQRASGTRGDLVAEGRDIGTVVFPDADVKVFLTACPEERSRRRHTELSASGQKTAADVIHNDLMARDKADSSREAGPLAVADDATMIDTTGLSVDDVVERIAAIAEARR